MCIMPSTAVTPSPVAVRQEGSTHTLFLLSLSSSSP